VKLAGIIWPRTSWRELQFYEFVSTIQFARLIWIS
jgi:hypothetical protein